MYIAFGGGFLILVVFVCVTLLQLTLVLRDVTKIMADTSEITARVKETVLDPLKAVSEFTSSFGFVRDLMERLRARFADGSMGDEVEVDEDPDAPKNPKDKKKSGFSINKLRK